ncbi:hypothetical protein [uncultured Phascolarctobacterium sp.]|uniref:hypothetical protein n=1 Tax=uncultured Phascolarctobacterium sp. TaxID=512296 RepID=UPI0027D9ADCC|nr:hypothetical protein [uncultured Phascolarctobacterium sp.]
MNDNLLWFAIGFLLCFALHLYLKRRIVKQLEKMTNAKGLQTLWVAGVRYALSQIERIW